MVEWFRNRVHRPSDVALGTRKLKKTVQKGRMAPQRHRENTTVLVRWNRTPETTTHLTLTTHRATKTLKNAPHRCGMIDNILLACILWRFCADYVMITRKFSNLIMYFESEALKKIERWLTIHGRSFGLAERFTFHGGG